MMDETGSVGFSRFVDPATGKLSATIVTAFVPNGVEDIELADRNGTVREVRVTNNVAVAEAENLAQPPAPAVSYKLPNGTPRDVELPAPPPSGS
jgi:hypothetical protein